MPARIRGALLQSGQVPALIGSEARDRRPFGRRVFTFALREGDLRLLLLVGDTVAAIAGTALAPILWAQVVPRYSLRPATFDLLVLSVLLWPLTLRLFGGGDAAQPQLGMRSLRASCQAGSAILLIILVSYYLRPFVMQRAPTLLALPLALTSILLWRRVYLIFVSSRVRRRVALLGDDSATLRVAELMATRDRGMVYEPVAFLANEPRDSVAGYGIQVRSTRGGLWRAVSALDIDEIVVGHTQGISAETLSELVECFERGVAAVPAAVLYEQLSGRVMADALEADWYADLPTHTDALYGGIKHACDVVLSLVLLGLTSPALAIIAAAILAETGRPLLLRQVRVGHRGQPFTMLKIRTMRQDAEADGVAVWAKSNDPRITKIGRFLRKSRLDEVPQLWNVVRGDMSLVGPRPERPEFVRRFTERFPLYRARSLLRPGITGWAQVQHGYAASIDDGLEKLEYDLFYLRHNGPFLDLRILLRTAGVVLRLGGR